MTQPATPAPKRAAIVVIHGIGEQRKFQTLDMFVRGLARLFRLKERQLEHHILQRKWGADTAIRFALPAPVGRGGCQVFDIYEHYWAEQVERKIGLRAVLGWLARTSLTPLLQWSQQPAVLFQEKGSVKRRAWILIREVLRAVFLLAIAAAVILPFVYAASQWSQVAASGRALWATLRAVEHPVWGLVFGVFLVFGALILNGGRQLLTKKARAHAGLDDATARWWAAHSLWAAALLISIAALIYVQVPLGGAETARAVWDEISPLPVMGPLLAALFGWAVRGVLIRFVGDVTIYVTADERSGFFVTRQAILKRSTDRVRELLTAGDYSAVYVVGHSLGSVIAYDTINRLARDVRTEDATPGACLTQGEFDRLRGLFTFGSPLDKIYYFFRTVVGAEESVRAQVLASLHGFKQKPSGRDYGDYRFARYTIPVPRDFSWFNVYSPEDPVSGHLDFYELQEQHSIHYPVPLAAHLSYWEDDVFYGHVGRWL